MSAPSVMTAALRISTCLLFFITANFGFAAEKYPLKNKLESGKDYTLRIESDIHLAVPGQPEAASHKQKITQVIDLKAKPESGTRNTLVEATFSSLIARIELEGQAYDYDSEDPAKAPAMIQQMFGSFLQKSLTLVYDQEGSFVEARDIQNIEATPLGQGQAMSGKELADTLRKTLEFGLPAQPVELGDKWTWKIDLAAPPLGVLAVESESTLVSATTNGLPVAQILIRGKIITPAGAADQLVTADEGSTYQGKVLFDLKQKLVTESSSSSTCQYEINGQKVQVTQKTSNVLSVKKS